MIATLTSALGTILLILAIITVSLIGVVLIGCVVTAAVGALRRCYAKEDGDTT